MTLSSFERTVSFCAAPDRYNILVNPCKGNCYCNWSISIFLSMSCVDRDDSCSSFFLSSVSLSRNVFEPIWLIRISTSGLNGGYII